MDQDAWAQGIDYARLPLDISRRVYESPESGQVGAWESTMTTDPNR